LASICGDVFFGYRRPTPRAALTYVKDRPPCLIPPHPTQVLSAPARTSRGTRLARGARAGQSARLKFCSSIGCSGAECRFMVGAGKASMPSRPHATSDRQGFRQHRPTVRRKATQFAIPTFFRGRNMSPGHEHSDRRRHLPAHPTAGDHFCCLLADSRHHDPKDLEGKSIASRPGSPSSSNGRPSRRACCVDAASSGPSASSGRTPPALIAASPGDCRLRQGHFPTCKIRGNKKTRVFCRLLRRRRRLNASGPNYPESRGSRLVQLVVAPVLRISVLAPAPTNGGDRGRILRHYRSAVHSARGRSCLGIPGSPPHLRQPLAVWRNMKLEPSV